MFMPQDTILTMESLNHILIFLCYFHHFVPFTFIFTEEFLLWLENRVTSFIQTPRHNDYVTFNKWISIICCHNIGATDTTEIPSR